MDPGVASPPQGYRARVKPADALHDLWAAVEVFDTEAADLVLASMLWDVPLSDAVTDVVLPFLHQLGERWEDGRLSVAHEHFASNLLRRRLSAFTPRQSVEMSSTPGPVVLLACPSGEQHDLVLLCFALLLGERGARVRFLGADTPVPAVVQAARATSADAVVLATTRATALTSHATALARLSEDHPVYVAGRGATAKVARETGARLMTGDPVQAVAELVADLAAPTGERR